MTTEQEDRATQLAREKCDRMLNETRTYSETDRYCPGMFDTLLCWNDTPAGTIANQSCPDKIELGFDPHRFAFKKCNENGTWYSVYDHPWTNYTACVNLEDFIWQQQVTSLYKIGYSISLVALIVSIAIFSYFRSLRCARITLHMNLFASFSINNALWLVWYRLLDDVEILQQNSILCQAVTIVLKYFLLTNYAWMLCEGLYLHTILVSAFIAESKLLLWMHLLGWLVPIIFIVPYTIVRILTGSTNYCWTEDSPFDYILSGPVCVLIGLNLLFLCNIVRELLVKLRADSRLGVTTTNRPSRTAIQALRATLLLAPLLGLSYLIIPFRPQNNQQLERIYDIMSCITSSFQGLFVTVLFCFCNTEVRSQVKRKWNNLRYRPRANSFTATTVTQYVAGEEKICLNETSKKHHKQNLSSQRHRNLDDGSTEKVNV